MTSELLKKLGEDTIYTAKGHFKACDIRRAAMTFTIWFCAVLNIVGLFGIESTFDRVLSALGLLGTIGILIWNEGEGKDYRQRHKQSGEAYLALHKEIHEAFLLEPNNEGRAKALREKVSKLDKSPRPEIHFFARRWAKSAIEKIGETNNWWQST